MSSFHMITASDARPADLMVQIVRFGSKADVGRRLVYVRFTPTRRHRQTARAYLR
jgi:hypothetical protein